MQKPRGKRESLYWPAVSPGCMRPVISGINTKSKRINKSIKQGKWNHFLLNPNEVKKEKKEHKTGRSSGKQVVNW